MKITTKRITLIFLCLLLTFNLTFNIFLLVSDTYKKDYVKEDYKNLEFANNIVLVEKSYDDNLRTYNNAFNAIANSSTITVKSTNVYNSESYAQDTMACSINDEGDHYICKMISALYDLEDNLIRTSYFPGDGYKYSIENNTKSKTIYSNENLENYFINMLNGTINHLSYLSYDPATIETLSFTTYINYDFSSLKNLTKDINVCYQTYKFNLRFDKYDSLTKLEIGNNVNIEIYYDLLELDFPSFEGFEE